MYVIPFQHIYQLELKICHSRQVDNKKIIVYFLRSYMKIKENFSFSDFILLLYMGDYIDFDSSAFH